MSQLVEFPLEDGSTIVVQVTAAFFAQDPDDEDQLSLSVELLYDPSLEPAEG